MFCILRSNGTRCIEHEYHYSGTYNVNVNVFFIFDKGRYRLRSPSSTQCSEPISCPGGGWGRDTRHA